MLNKVNALILSLATLLTAASANCEEHPETLVGFLKPGMFVATYTSGHDEKDRTFIIFESETQSQMVSDTLRLDLQALRDKYPAVERQAKETLRAYVSKIKNEARESGDEVDLREPTLHKSGNTPLSHRKVVHVGKDYVLFENAGGKRTAVRETEIKKVEWARPSFGLGFYVTPASK